MPAFDVRRALTRLREHADAGLDYLRPHERRLQLALSRVWRERFWPQQKWRRVATSLLGALLLIEVADFVAPPPLTRLERISTLVADRRGAALRVFPVDDGKWRLHADFDHIDPRFISALLAYEDKRFFDHGGVDLAAISRAAASLAQSGHIVSGGSTITMQTARLLEPRPRNLGAKIIESIRAWQIERRLTKRQILEAYLTLAPYGGNLEGVRAASWAYFGREPDHLSPDQIAMLVALPQSPESRRPDLHPKAAIVARRRVLLRLADKGLFAADLAAESAEYPAPKRHPFPGSAWQASEEALRRMGKPGDIRTTLDGNLQAELEEIARNAVGSGRDGVQAAVMAIDIRTREVRAMVGSATRQGDAGWMDLTDRPRSPGSTLKPFIYGLAFDDGVASSRTRIADAPKRFASYRPDDFDRTFRGDVTVAEALQHSLNVPAVSALDKVGAQRFAAALAFAGVDPSIPLTADEDAGLAIGLGGLGLTVRDLAVLYAALGDGGRAKPLVWLAMEAEKAAKTNAAPNRIMSEQSAKAILDILKAGPAPKGRMPALLTQAAPVIAFKTGTSYGYRDAWAAGVGGGYAIVVWTGRPDGAPRAGVTGREGALPILFDAFDAVARMAPSPEDTPSLEASGDDDRTPPAPLQRFERETAPPQILFPPDGAEVWADAAGQSFVLAAEGRGKLDWYADGSPLPRNAAGDPLWKPPGPGFYDIRVVDTAGRTAHAKVRLRTPEN